MLLDLVLPGVNGMDVLRECRKNNHEICIIVVTSYGSEATAVEAIQEGADDYVVKDFMLMNDAKSLDIVIRPRVRKEKTCHRKYRVDQTTQGTQCDVTICLFPGKRRERFHS